MQTEAKIGLALSGGVSRGPAHLGVLEVIEREKIPIRCVSGVSAGALAGAIYCSGLGLGRVRDQALSLTWGHLARLVWPRRGFVSFAPLEAWLVKLIGDLDFAALPLPLAVVATDLETGEPVVLREGRVARAVHASCAVPGFAEPVELNGRLLGDGGVANNLPAAFARQLGADYVIGVDLFQPTLKRRWGPLTFSVAALEHLVRRSGGGLAEADLVICPQLAGKGYLSFSRGDELVALGARAAEAALPSIAAWLGRNDPLAETGVAAS